MSSDRISRNELLETISSQREQLQRYETRFRDVVKAYKSLQKEKEALEESFKALTSSSPQHSTPSASLSSEGAEPDSGQSQEKNEGDQQEIVREKLQTLSRSLTTVSEEKSRMEASYQAEKKMMKAEHESVVAKWEETCRHLQTQVDTFQSDLSEVKTKYRNQQLARDKDEADHAVMLREIQTKLTSERNKNEMLEHQIEDLKLQTSAIPRKVEELRRAQKQVQDLNSEMEELKRKMQTTIKENDEKKNDEAVTDLQKELAETKARHRIRLEKEQARTEEIQRNMNAVMRDHEVIVRKLEEKLSELMAVIGQHEHSRKQDLHTIQALKERLTQLDLENSALTRAGNSLPSDEASVDEIVQCLNQLRNQLRQRCEKDGLNVETLLNDLHLTTTNADDERGWKDKYSRLKEEFEKYKTRAHSVLRTKDSLAAQELEDLRQQAIDVKGQLQQLQTELSEKDDAIKQEKRRAEEKLQKALQSHRSELDQKERECLTRIAEMDKEMVKQRERTQALVAEKDAEMRAMREAMTQYQHREPPGAAPSSHEMDDMVSSLLGPNSDPNGSGRGLLFYTQELARKEVEVQQLREQKKQGAGELREARERFEEREAELMAQLTRLLEEVDRLHRMHTLKDDAHLEYLKNVVYNYLTQRRHSDPGSKRSMLNAIATVLHFTNLERRTVEEAQALAPSKWWTSTRK